MKVLLGVTGGVAVYKALDLISGLQKAGNAEVRVIMTENATRFVNPMLFATISKNPVMTDMWVERDKVEHIEVGKWATALVVYPATANIIGKFANGIADDLLSTVYLAFPRTEYNYRIVFPAMNTNMYRHPATERNIQTLNGDGVVVADTRTTTLACGDKGEGGVLKPREAVAQILEGIPKY
jgi:phosphopantothenoylcysteine decarboxylase/phosphopantothenate--cysteine ligase